MSNSKCQHDRVKHRCRDCGTGICKHGKFKHLCYECGVGYCLHGRQKYRCRDCGRGICEHDKDKYGCRLCKSNKCKHGNYRYQCIDCSIERGEIEHVSKRPYRKKRKRSIGKESFIVSSDEDIPKKAVRKRSIRKESFIVSSDEDIPKKVVRKRSIRKELVKVEPVKHNDTCDCYECVIEELISEIKWTPQDEQEMFDYLDDLNMEVKYDDSNTDSNTILYL